MDYLVWKYAVFAIILLQWKIQLCHCEYQDVGKNIIKQFVAILLLNL